MSELVIRHGLRLDANLTVSNGEPLLARTASTGLVSVETGVGGGGSAPFSDSTPLLFNSTDSSKLAQFSTSGITTGTVRTYNLPDQDGTIALTSDLSGADFWKLTGDTLLSGAATIKSGSGGPYSVSFGDGSSTGLGSYTVWTASDYTLSLRALNLGYFSMSGFTQKVTFQDFRAVPLGIEYSADYSATYTTRSLVDKAYVDAAILAGGGGGGSGPYWPLGGPESLTADTTIFLNANDIIFSGSAYEVGFNETSVGAYPLTVKHVANNKYLGLSDSGIQVLDEGIELFRATNSDLAWNNPGGNIDISQAAAGTFTFTNKVSFTSENSSAPINIGGSADAVGTVNGDIWYDSTNNKLRIREGGVSKDVADPFAVIEDVPGTTYLFVAADHQKVKRFTNASGCTATVPLGLRTGWTTTVYRASGAGTITLASNGSLESSAATLETEKTAASIVHRGSDVHVAWGALGAIGGGGSGISGLTAGRVVIATGATTIGDDAGLTYDSTNNSLTVGYARFHTYTGLVGSPDESLFIGKNAGNFTNTGDDNIGIGGTALIALTTGTANTVVGHAAATDITSATSNTLIGWLSGSDMTTGSRNTAVGASTIYTVTTATDNTAVGYGAGSGLGGGSGNVMIGVNSMGTATVASGSNNTFLGSETGRNITTASQTVLIGYDIDAPSTTATGQLSIQNAIYGVSNTGNNTTVSTGRIGLYTSAPTARLHLPAGAAAANNAPLKFTTGTALTTPESGAMEFHGSHLYFTIGSTRHQLDQQVSIGSTQVAFGAGTNILGGDSAFIYNSATNLLTVDNITLGTGTAGNIRWGNYTPTYTAVAGSPTAFEAYPQMYTRIGDRVIVSGTIDFDHTAGAVVGFKMTLPFTAAFSAIYSASGSAVSNKGVMFTIQAEGSAGDEVYFNSQSTTVTGTATFLTYTFQYVAA